MRWKSLGVHKIHITKSFFDINDRKVFRKGDYYDAEVFCDDFHDQLFYVESHPSAHRWLSSRYAESLSPLEELALAAE